ncbi:MAG TPA: hypothetical protein VLA12_14645, partial [Planctomycetaceae bacterium]|nr:hypothetical protein [Planctomycetaceae bacterium]
MRILIPLSFCSAFLLGPDVLTAQETSSKTTIRLSPAETDKCLKILREGLRSDEFWPAIHAAEGLTLGGYGSEVIEFLQPKVDSETDDQRRCGLARELVRAGKKQYAQVMYDILAGDDPYGHIHAAESLYKVFRIGDGVAMRKAFAQQD